MRSKGKVVLNLGRIGRFGTGLFSFSEGVFIGLSRRFDSFRVFSGFEHSFLTGKDFTKIPHWISISQRTSITRPLLWYIYSSFVFPASGDYLISPTHHVVRKFSRQVVTIHDLRPYFYPDSFAQKYYFRSLLPKALKKIDGVLTVSGTSRELISKVYGFPLERIHVVSNQIDTNRFFPVEDGPEVVSSDSEPYLLMVGANLWNKNLHQVLSYSYLWKDNFSLKIVGGESQYLLQMKKKVLKAGLGKKVFFLDYVSPEKLVSLYRNAYALLYPSIMEGFGIPPLEAMACGTPVLVSDLKVFREIYQDAATFIRLEEKQSWEEGFSRLYSSDWIRSKKKEGVKRASIFNLNRMVTELDKALLAIWPELFT